VSKIFECLICGEPDDRPTCVRCYSRLQFMIVELPEQYCLLLMCREWPGTGGGGRSATAVHGRLPGREDVLSLLGPAARQSPPGGRDQTGPTPFRAVLQDWIEVVDEARNLTPCDRDVPSMSERLLTYLPWVTMQPFVGDLYREIEELLRVVRRITLAEPSGRMELLRGVACPSCGRFSMVRYHPSDWRAECRFCPAIRLDDAAYEDLVRGQARDAGDTG
jgi:hypothetical protein